MSINPNPPAETAEPSPAPQAEEVSFQDAFRAIAAQDASDESGNAPAVADDPTTEASTPASPEPGDSQAAPVADTRRAAEIRASEDALKVELERIKTEAESHKTKAAELETTITTAQREALAQLGTDEEFKQLADKRLDPSQLLTYAEDERYAELVQSRKSAATWLQMANTAIRTQDAKVAQERGTKLGIDPEAMARASGDVGALIDFVAASVETRLKATWADEKARLEADATSARTKLAGTSRDPGRGGISGGPGRARTEDLPPDASSHDLFAAVFRDVSESRNGSARPRP